MSGEMRNNSGQRSAALNSLVQPDTAIPTNVFNEFEMGELNENEQQFLGELLQKAEGVEHHERKVATPKPPPMSETARVRFNHNVPYPVMQKAEFYIEHTAEKLQKGIRRGRVRFSNVPNSLGRQSSIDIDTIVHPQKELPKTIDLEQHQDKMKKFRADHRRRVRQQRQLSTEIAKSIQEREEREKQLSKERREKELAQRRKQAEFRLKQIEATKKERQKSVSLANQRFMMVKDSKTLEDIYTERFTKEFVLPELEEKKNRLEKLRQMTSPINFQQLKEHQKQYFQRKREKELAKEKSQQLQKQLYKPPEYVPTSYLIVQEQQRDKEIKELEKKQKQIETARNKEKLIEFLEDKFREQVRKNKLLKKTKKEQRENRTIETAPLNYQQTRDRGNSYFEEMKKMLKRKPTEPIKVEPDPPTSKLFPEASPYQKEERVRERQKIRNIRIANIINDQKAAKTDRQLLLKHQSQILDELLHRKETIHKLRKPEQHELEETTGLVLSSLQTKLALLNINSPKKKNPPPQIETPAFTESLHSED